MKVYIKESLYALDYDNNILDLLYASDDKETPGYAYEIKVEDSNTGYSNLSFKIPNVVMIDGVDQLNSKMNYINALGKVRYERIIMYMGEEAITVSEPSNDFEGNVHNITYNTGDIMEEYVMDYIIQPFERNRENLQIVNTFTAIDYPRYVLSKKKSGLIIDDTLTTTADLSIINGKPTDVAGSVKYTEWSTALNVLVGRSEDAPLVWDPKSVTYPLTTAEIQTLINTPSLWTYGVLCTAFYWPIQGSGRVEGVLYEEGNYIVLNVYNTLLEGYTFDSEDYTLLLDNLAANWSQLDVSNLYLSPNNALNYLKYILSDTGWSVDTVKSANYIGEDGVIFTSLVDLENYVTSHSITLTTDNYSIVNETVYKWSGTAWVDITTSDFARTIDKTTGYKYNVDLEQEEIYLPDDSTNGKTELVNKTCSLEINDSNCYNGVTSLSEEVQLYPYFNCIKKTVGLKARPGKNYGLTYRFGSNIQDNSVTINGEKVITRLYVTGGTDANGNENINIGNANRQTVGELITPISDGVFNWLDDAPTTERKLLCPVDYITIEEGITYKTGTYYKDGSNYKYCVEISPLSFITLTSTSEMKLIINGTQYSLKDYKGEAITIEKWMNGLRGIIVSFDGSEIKETTDFNPNDDIYIESRSPYGTSYILNFKYLYDRGYIQRDDIVLIYKAMIKLGLENKRTLSKYSTDYIKSYNDYLTALNNQDLYGTTYSASLNSMMNLYYVNPETPTSAGTFYAFSDKPTDAYTGAEMKTNYPTENLTYLDDASFYLRIADESHVYGYVEAPVFPDGNDNAGDNRYKPKTKGFALSTIEQLNFNFFKNQMPALRTLTPEEILAIQPNIASTDPSGTVTNYGAYSNKFVGYFKKTWQASQDIVLYKKNIEDIDVMYQEYLDKTKLMESNLQETYGDYIVEGSYKNENQPYVNLLFKEAITASEKFGYPDVTYDINVIDSAGLFEYRNTSLKEYNEIVTNLLSRGQIIPKAGDEVTIIDTELGMEDVLGMITTITRIIDKPMDNTLTIDTTYTDEEELVGNIITATNTVLNNTDIYARTAILNKDGTINSTSLKTSLDNPSADISIVGAQGATVLDSTGVTLTDTSDIANQLKISGSGVFSSSDGGTNWDGLITSEGINATHLTAGTIDTRQISIIDGGSKKVILNNNGLVIKNDANLGYEIGGTWNNVKAFIGVDNTTNRNGQVFVDGMIRATEGSEIAGWSIGADKIYKEVTTSGSESYVALSSDSSDYAIVAGTSSNPADYKFTVTHDGDATIGGGAVILDRGGVKIAGDDDYILNLDGLYTNLTFPGRALYKTWNTMPSFNTNVQYADFGLCGNIISKNYDGFAREGVYTPIYIVADIPDNFVIKKAKINVRHYPNFVSGLELGATTTSWNVWGYSRDIKLFKTPYLKSPAYNMYTASTGAASQYNTPPYDLAGRKLISNYTWESTGSDTWNPTAPTGDPLTGTPTVVANMEEKATNDMVNCTVDGVNIFQPGLNCYMVLATSPVPYYIAEGVGTGVYNETFNLDDSAGGWHPEYRFQSTAAADSLISSNGFSKYANRTYCLVGNPTYFSSTYAYFGNPADLVPYIWNGTAWVNQSAHKITTTQDSELYGVPAGTHTLGLTIDTRSGKRYSVDTEVKNYWFEKTEDGTYTTTPLTVSETQYTAERCGNVEATLTLFGYYKPTTSGA